MFDTDLDVSGCDKELNFDVSGCDRELNFDVSGSDSFAVTGGIRVLILYLKFFMSYKVEKRVYFAA